MIAAQADLKVGDSYTERLVDDLKRAQIVQYAGAAGDYYPLHTDEVFATRVAGFPSTFAHGMLIMGMTGRALTNYVGVNSLTKFGVRFLGQAWPGDTLDATLIVTALREHDRGRLATFDVKTVNQGGKVVLDGYAEAMLTAVALA